MRFCGHKNLVQRIFMKKCLLFRVASVSHVKFKELCQERSKVADYARAEGKWP
jgi:hypothetical protein